MQWYLKQANSHLRSKQVLKHCTVMSIKACGLLQVLSKTYLLGCNTELVMSCQMVWLFLRPLGQSTPKCSWVCDYRCILWFRSLQNQSLWLKARLSKYSTLVASQSVPLCWLVMMFRSNHQLMKQRRLLLFPIFIYLFTYLFKDWSLEGSSCSVCGRV